MAADILLFGSHVVPVGEDQRQHIEIAQDIAQAFNRTYGEVLTIPEAVIGDAVADIPGTDGRKMSKSYGNVIPIFSPPESLRKQIMGMVTDSRDPFQPKDPEQDSIFRLYAFFANPGETDALRKKYLRGGFGYGEAKQALFGVLERTFGEARGRYEKYMQDRPYLDGVLRYGAVKARTQAAPMLEKVRQAAGIRNG
jgi:tryptophanyl-tRNA synthetase